MQLRFVRDLLLLAALGASPLPGCATAPPLQSSVDRAITANGVKIWYEIRGVAGKPPLVVINGGPGFDHTYMLTTDVWDRLARRRPVVLYDQRGVGRSEPFKAGSPQTVLDHVADLDALRTALGVERVDLAGHSWGGYLGMAYAVHHPRHVGRLVLCGSAAPRFDETLFLFNALYPEVMERHGRLDALRQRGDEVAGKAALRELLRTLFVSAEKRDEFLRKNEGLSLNYAMNEALEADAAKHDLGPGLRDLRARTLVITGRFDANVGPETAWKIHKAIAGSQIRFFERSGHFPFVEEPDRFVEELEGFLDAP